MSIPLVNTESLIKQLDNFDYVRFSLCDLNGIARGKAVPAKIATDFIKNGLSIFTGAVATGPSGQNPVDLIDVNDDNSGNMSATPCLDVIYLLPWAAGGKYKVGEILCETKWNDDRKMQEANPRFAARKQIEKLASMGFKLISAYEVEALVVDKKTHIPANKSEQTFSLFALSKHEELFYKCEQMLASSGIKIETIMAETGAGQYEFTFQPCEGIESADMVFRFKQAMKELCYQNEYHFTTMSCAWPCLRSLDNKVLNGLHFNFSLWDLNQENKNIFTDRNEDNCLSKTDRNEDNCLSETDRNEDNCLSKTDRNEDNCLSKTDRNEDNCLSKTDRNEDNCLSKTDRNEDNCLSKTDRNEDNCLSKTALFFIGGIIKHYPALTALCCPTTNCNRRMRIPGCPDRADWGMENRFCTLRVKRSEDGGDIYMENRLPSGLCNPYIAMAATIAAGIDGMKNKIHPPTGGKRMDAKVLPVRLEKDIASLENDSVLKEALGPKLVEWFVYCKRNYDLKKFRGHGFVTEDEQQAEEKEYFEAM